MKNSKMLELAKTVEQVYDDADKISFLQEHLWFLCSIWIQRRKFYHKIAAESFYKGSTKKVNFYWTPVVSVSQIQWRFSFFICTNWRIFRLSNILNNYLRAALKEE